MEETLNIGKSTERFKTIVQILSNYGIADWLSDTKVEWIKTHLKNNKGKDLTKFTKEQRIRMALTELGTTFIKLGQVLSTRSDLIGEDLAQELSQLQSSTPADGIVKVRKRIKNEFGVKSIDDLFESFSNKPIASASIAQVHEAKLHSGEDVVVKVMHEGIEEKVEEDLKIMIKLAGMAQRYSVQLKPYQPLSLIRQFSNTLMDELDFNIELDNLRKFSANFADDDRVVFPVGYDQQSGKTVLTMSFLDGQPLQNVNELDLTQEQKSDFTEESADIFMEMMFRDRFYHADPHPGNLLFREDGSLGILDCGMVGKLDSKSHKIFEELIIGVAQKDAEHIKNTILDMCTLPRNVDYDAFTNQIDQFLENYLDLPLNELDMSAAIKEGISIIQEHHLIMPANISTLMRVVVLLEGSSRLLNPDFNIAVLFEKYHFKIIKRRYAPKNIVQRLVKNVNQWEHIAEMLPKRIERLLHNAGKENFGINLEHRNLEESVNRLVMGLITAALFLGSSILWAFKVPPLISGYSVFGIAGVVISSVLTYKLIKEIKARK
jgi:ubiquinone biosynthesis protein